MTATPPIEVPEIRTARLLLRTWRDEDRAPFAALNADPQVMEFFPALLSGEESDRAFDRIGSHFRDRGYGLWAVEIPGVAPFIGFVGLKYPHLPEPFAPRVEVGWRLAHAYWNLGYATEGGRAALAVAFDRLGFDEVVSMTVPTNVRSRRVMDKLGLRYAPTEDFDHPLIAVGHPLRRHVLYRGTASSCLR